MIIIILFIWSDTCTYPTYLLNYFSIFNYGNLRSTDDILKVTTLLQEDLSQLNRIVYDNMRFPFRKRILGFWQNNLTSEQRSSFLKFFWEQTYLINNIIYTINSWGRHFNIGYILKDCLRAMDRSFELFTEDVMRIKFTLNHYDSTNLVNVKYRYHFHSWYELPLKKSPLAKGEYTKFFNSYNRNRLLIERHINHIPADFEAPTWESKHTLIALGVGVLTLVYISVKSCV